MQLKNPYAPNAIIKNVKNDVQKVMIIENEFEEAVRAHSYDLTSMYNAWDHYFVQGNSQQSQQVLRKIRNEGFEARAYDVISPKTDTLAGVLVSELPDIDWTPVEGQKTSATEAIKDSWISDKELTNTEYEHMLAIRDGLVHVGWMQLYETTKYGKPVIGFSRVMPGFFIPSGYWVQESDRLMDVGFKIGYLTPSQMKLKYKNKSQEIMDAIRRIEISGHEELPANAFDQRRRYIGRIADHYKIYPSPVKIHCIFSTENTFDSFMAEKSKYGWKRYAQGGFNIIKIKGDHDIILKDNRKVIALEIKKLLEMSES